MYVRNPVLMIVPNVPSHTRNKSGCLSVCTCMCKSEHAREIKLYIGGKELETGGVSVCFVFLFLAAYQQISPTSNGPTISLPATSLSLYQLSSLLLLSCSYQLF